MARTPILTLRRLMCTGHGDPMLHVPIKSVEDYNTRHHPSFVKYLKQHGWTLDDWCAAVSISFEEDGMWNDELQTFIGGNK